MTNQEHETDICPVCGKDTLISSKLAGYMIALVVGSLGVWLSFLLIGIPLIFFAMYIAFQTWRKTETKRCSECGYNTGA